MKKSIGARDKLRLKAEFDYVREHGVKHVGRLFLLVAAAPSPDNLLRCGVICGKKYNKRAVVRNRARRLLWESFRLLKAQIGPCHLVLITRQAMMGVSQPEVQAEMMTLLVKAKALRED